jgi:hypothetical protein
MSSSDDDVLATIQGWYAAHPTDDLRNLLEAIAAGDHAPGGEYGVAVPGMWFAASTAASPFR